MEGDFVRLSQMERNMNEAIKKKLLLALKYIPAWVPLMLALMYCFGYSIVAIYMRSNGLVGLSLFEPQYFEVGTTFCFITFTLCAVPWLLSCLHKNFSSGQLWRAFRHFRRVFRLHENCSYKIRWSAAKRLIRRLWISAIRLSALILVIICVVVFMLFTLFATGYEWNKAIGDKGGLGFAGPFKIYLPAMLIVFWLLPVLRKKNFDNRTSWFSLDLDPKTNNLASSLAIRTLYTLVIIYGLVITYNFVEPVVREIDWVWTFCKRAWDYLFFVLMIFLSAFVLWSISTAIKKDEVRIRRLLWLVGAPFLILCAYSSLTMYAYRIYHVLPVRSGGMCPSAVMRIDGQEQEYYLIAETPELLVVAPVTNTDWFASSLPLTVFNRKDVKKATFHQKYDGHPRNNSDGKPLQLSGGRGTH